MKITELKIKNFKRFTDLTVSEIPSETKLVLLIGANGSGKTSVFDAFEWISKLAKALKYEDEDEYYKKDTLSAVEVQILFSNGESLIRTDQTFDQNSKEVASKFYGRSSLRIVPRISNVSFNENLITQDSDRPTKYIDFDKRFDTDVTKYIQDINKAARDIIFSNIEADTINKREERRDEIVARYIEPFNKSLANIFGTDKNTTIRLVQYDDASNGNPPKLVFSKGNSRINYDLLSHGEKQVVIILLNFLIRDKQDTIFFIDEMDVHLNTSLQYALLKEISETWIPENSQLWTASHSLGFIEFARDFEKGVVLDFDQLNFDEPQTIKPENSVKVFEIAVPQESLGRIFYGKDIFVCENKDDEIYNSIGIEKAIFIGVRSAEAVFAYIKGEQNFFGIRDRDFLTDKEREKIMTMFPRYKILEYYNIENYLYHPENLEEVSPNGFTKTDYVDEILRQKKSEELAILNDIKAIRKSYQELSVDGIKDQDISQLNEDITSEEFERFYKYFNMRDKFNKSYLNNFKIAKIKLAQTNWFKERISQILRINK